MIAEMVKILKQEQTNYALLALQSPSDKNAFEYGKHAGVVWAFEEIINKLIIAATEEDKNGRNL